MKRNKIKIDLNGPDGNAFVLLGVARKLPPKSGRAFNEIQIDMTAGDYRHLLEVFGKEFGDSVEMKGGVS